MAGIIDPSNSGYITFDTNNQTYGTAITNTTAITGSITAGTGLSSADSVMTAKPIEGTMLTVQDLYTEQALKSMPEDAVKLNMCQKLAEEMYKSDCIHFTKQYDLSTDSTFIRARCYVVPNSDVQLLLKAGYTK